MGAENGVAADSSTWASRNILVIGAATGMGQAVVTAFAAAGARRIALMDSGDMSVTRYRAHQAAAAKQLAPPDLLTLQLEHEDSALLDQRVEELSRKWGHVDFIINHAIHQLFFVEHSTLNERAMEDGRGKWFETGFKNIYAVIDAFLPLLFAGHEKTFINIIPDSTFASKPGIGAKVIAETANRHMADLLLVDHGDEDLLAYSIHSSRTPSKGISASANKGMSASYKDGQKLRRDINVDSLDSLKQLEQDGNAVVYLTATRRDWLAGRHISSTQNVRELVAHQDVIVRDDLLRYKSAVSFDLPSGQPRRGRVPRSSY